MTYDAVLVARRGLGVDEQRQATVVFAAAVRWAAFAQTLAPELASLRRVATTDPPKSVTGQPLIEFMANRTRAKGLLKDTEAALYPPDEDADG